MNFGPQVALAVMAVLLKVGSATVPVQVPSRIPLGLLRLWLAAEQDVPLEAVSLWYNGRRLGDKLPLGIHLPPNACIEAMVSLPGGKSKFIMMMMMIIIIKLINLHPIIFFHV